MIHSVEGLTYQCHTRLIKSEKFRDIIESKLNSELDQLMLTIVDTPVECAHALFCVPKDDGGGRLIVVNQRDIPSIIIQMKFHQNLNIRVLTT